MKMTAKEWTLKDGRKAIIRQALESDAEQMIHMSKQCCSETRNLSSTAEEYATFTVEMEKKWINDRNVTEHCYKWWKLMVN